MLNRRNNFLKYHAIFISGFVLATFISTTGCNPEKKEWTKASDAGTLQGYQSYLSQYPDGEHATEATALIIEIQYWDSLSAVNEPDALCNYIIEYPNGRFLDTAQWHFVNMEQKAFEAARTVNTYDSYEEFYTNFLME